MVKCETIVFYLLSCGINNTKVDWRLFNNFLPKDWAQLYIFSKKQGIVAIIFDLIKSVPKELAPPKDIALKWLSHTYSIEIQMKQKEAVAIEFAEKLSEKGIQTAVLKGISYALYFPNSYYRESGDLDCFLMGKKEEGDQTVIEIGGMMEDAGYKHSHLYYKSLTIENHKFITSFDNTKLGIRVEQILQEQIRIGCRYIGNTKLLNPSVDFNALFIIKHAQRHFIQEGIRIRHILDWAFFLNAESSNVNWAKVIPIMDECKILKFAQVLTSICVEKLGMSINIEGLNVNNNISDIVLMDIISDQPDLFHENFFQKIRRIIRRFYRMWKFRSLADEGYLRLVWNTFAFSSYLNRRPQLPK
ncbi:MAG: hypothetical protein E7142_05505 [Rikenellaceae bacterium]|nr:hypothetical protein [Rikenellaceae bacterium]